MPLSWCSGHMPGGSAADCVWMRARRPSCRGGFTNTEQQAGFGAPPTARAACTHLSTVTEVCKDYPPRRCVQQKRGREKCRALFVLRVHLLLTRAVLPCSSASTPASAGAALVGVGMEFDSQRMIITGLRPGCAAAYSKQITIGDHLVAVDRQETYDFKRARDLILGVQGSSVAITFKKNGSSQLYTVSLLRGTADYIHMAERCKHLDTRIAQLEAENKQLLEASSRPTRCWCAECIIAHMSKSRVLAQLLTSACRGSLAEVT